MQKEENLKLVKKLKNLSIYLSFAIRDAEFFNIEELAKGLKSYKEIKKILYWEVDLRGNIAEFMSETLGRCNVLSLFCSENAINSLDVEEEWKKADMLGIPIIPVFLEVDHIPPVLKSRLSIKYDLIDFGKNIIQLHSLILNNCAF